jgi:hypothetical protein
MCSFPQSGCTLKMCYPFGEPQSGCTLKMCYPFGEPQSGCTLKMCYPFGEPQSGCTLNMCYPFGEPQSGCTLKMCYPFGEPQSGCTLKMCYPFGEPQSGCTSYAYLLIENYTQLKITHICKCFRKAPSTLWKHIFDVFPRSGSPFGLHIYYVLAKRLHLHIFDVPFHRVVAH